MKTLVKELRSDSKLTQEAFSAKVGISLRYLQTLEKGSSIPSLVTLDKIAKAFNISIKDLIED